MPDKEFKETLKEVNQYKILKEFDIGKLISSLKTSNTPEIFIGNNPNGID